MAGRPIEIGSFVEVTVGNFKGEIGYVKSFRPEDNSYKLGKVTDENHAITQLRWYGNEIKLT